MNGFVTGNQFHHATSSAGIEQKGGANQNAFYEYDRSQRAPAPTVTAGQLLYTESQLGGGAWHVPVELYVKFHAQTHDATEAAGLNLFDERDTFVGNLAVRNSRNRCSPARSHSSLRAGTWSSSDITGLNTSKHFGCRSLVARLSERLRSAPGQRTASCTCLPFQVRRRYHPATDQVPFRSASISMQTNCGRSAAAGNLRR